MLHELNNTQKIPVARPRVYTLNPSTQGTERISVIQDQPSLHIEFQVSQGYIMRPWFGFVLLEKKICIKDMLTVLAGPLLHADRYQWQFRWP